MPKILVVDDEPDMIWALTNVLLSEDYSVVSVNSGEEALDKVNQVALDLVLLDFRLPGMDGIQILEKIKQIKPDLPVIMLTGYGGIEEAVQSIKLGAAHYIPKPFENQHLIEVIKKSLQLNTLKKDSVFGKRIAEKIQPGPAVQSQPATVVREKQTTPAKKFPLLAVSLTVFILAAILGSVYIFNYEKNRDRDYQLNTSMVSGLSWGGNSLWTSDWFSQKVQQYGVEGSNLILLKTFSLPNFHLTGIAWAEDSLYTCDSWKKVITKHSLNDVLTVTASFPSPGPNPSGLYYDGKYLWSCDGTTRKIYQHALDDKLTVIASYDSLALFPVGLYHDKTSFWYASALGMKIYKHSLQERFKLEKAYTLPDSLDIGQQISAFAVDKDRIWVTYEGVDKLCSRSLKKLQEVAP